MMTMKLVTIKLIKKPKKTKLLKKTVMEGKTKVVQMKVKMKLPEMVVIILPAATILMMMRMLMAITQMMIPQKKLKEVMLNHLNGYCIVP